MSRSLAAAICLGLLFPTAGCDKSGASREKTASTAPSVFIIVMDAMAARFLGCYDDPMGASPNIDRFAAEAVLFENAYSQTATTVPSTASLMTGVRATTHRLSSKSRLSTKYPTMSEWLGKAGFSTIAFIGNPHAGASELGLDRGFQTCRQVWAQPALQNTRPLEDSTRFRVTWPEDVNEQVMAALPAVKATGAFMYIHYLQPHKPYDPPARYVEKFDPDRLGKCKCGGKTWAALHEEFESANVTGHVDAPIREHLLAQYRANVAYVDAAFGELVAALKQRGLYDESLIIATADHGDAFFDHKRFGHNVHLYDDMVRIPMIVKPPRSDGVVPRGIRSLVETIDVLPTVLDVAGLEPPAGLEGQSLLPILLGEVRQLADPTIVMSTFDLRKHAIRMGDLKYIYSSEESQELYDLSTDPTEQVNLIASKRKEAAALRQKLEQFIDLTTGTKQENPSNLRSNPEMDRLLGGLGYVEGGVEQAVTQPTEQE